MTMIRLKGIACLVVAASLLSACSKNEEAPVAGDGSETSGEAAAPVAAAAPEAPGIETMPGENAVRGALAAKNYESAVSQLVAMKRGLPNEMWPNYQAFYGEVRNALADAAETDPKAAQSLAIMRSMTAGR